MALESLYKLGRAFIPGFDLLPPGYQQALGREALAQFGANLMAASDRPGATLGGATGQAFSATRQEALRGLEPVARLQQLELVRLQADKLRDALERSRGAREAVKEFVKESGGATNFQSVADYYAALSRYLSGKGFVEQAATYAALAKQLKPSINIENLPGGGGSVVLADGNIIGRLPYVPEPQKPSEKTDLELKLHDRFVKEVGNPLTQAVQAYRGLVSSLEQATGTGDVASIYQFIKALDPESVVRPGEVELAQSAESLWGHLQVLVKRIASGEQLTPKLRREMAETARRLLETAYESHRPALETYREVVQRNQLPAEFVIGGIPDVESVLRAPLPAFSGRRTEAPRRREQEGGGWSWLRNRFRAR